MDPPDEDTMLVNLLLNKENIEDFFDSIFGCLARCTDFYHVITSPEDKMGYAPGKIEEIVLQSLHKFSNSPPQLDYAPVAIEEVEVGTAIDPIDAMLELEKLNLNDIDDMEFQPADYHNGALYDNYCWSQTLSDIQIHVKLPVEIYSAKHLNVSLTSEHLKVTEKDNPDNIILEGALKDKCRYNDVVWSVTSSNLLQINIDKISEMWWDKLFATEDKIDVQKIDSSVFIDDLSETERQVVDKIKWDQQQQLMVDEISTERMQQADILKRAWDADGSPFRGQTFDPSGVKFN